MKNNSFVISHTAIIILAFLSCSINMRAKVVSTDEALQVATEFFYGKTPTRAASPQLREVMNSRGLRRAASKADKSGDPTFYIFAPEQGSDFVIVAGDDVSVPILAYSFEDAAPEEDDIPCNVLWW